MRCTFCSSPSAEPATGCQYGPRTFACRACVDAFWSWAHALMRTRARGGPETALTLHESAALFGTTLRGRGGRRSLRAAQSAERSAARHVQVGARDR